MVSSETPRSRGYVDEEMMATLRLYKPESSGLPSMPRTIIEGDTTCTTLGSDGSHCRPAQCSEYKYAPSLSIDGETTVSGASSTLNGSPTAVSQAKIEKTLGLRPDDQFRIPEYIFDKDANINVNERLKRDGGILPSPGTRSHLPCPFRSLDGCEVMFDVEEKKLWKWHTLEHFQDVKPPQILTCTFGDHTGLCGVKFVIEDGKEVKRIQNWSEKLEHFAKHYEDILHALCSVFDEEDPTMGADALSETTDTPDEHFEAYIRRERRRLEGIKSANHLPPSYGGARRREVVYERRYPYSEQPLASSTATYCLTSTSGNRANRSERITWR